MKYLLLAVTLFFFTPALAITDDEQEMIDQVLDERTNPEELTKQELADRIDLLRARTMMLLGMNNQLTQATNKNAQTLHARDEALQQLIMFLAQHIDSLTEVLECMSQTDDDKEFKCTLSLNDDGPQVQMKSNESTGSSVTENR